MSLVSASFLCDFVVLLNDFLGVCYCGVSALTSNETEVADFIFFSIVHCLSEDEVKLSLVELIEPSL